MSFAQLSALSGLDQAAIAQSLDELDELRILVASQATGDVVYEFAHPMVQQVVYGSLPPGRSRLLHSRVADALEDFYGDAAERHSGELSYHFSRSGAQGAKTVRYLLRRR